MEYDDCSNVLALITKSIGKFRRVIVCPPAAQQLSALAHSILCCRRHGLGCDLPLRCTILSPADGDLHHSGGDIRLRGIRAPCGRNSRFTYFFIAVSEKICRSSARPHFTASRQLPASLDINRCFSLSTTVHSSQFTV
jgi:hypothetical protein